ncbi:hypothetical protein [Streptomyces sp. NPDC051572]|uniref:hypothetical protein n=1 Tax=Streptomyces sp. NPDC051572 TaxID=3155802 RepID=UPI00344D01C0
MAEPQKTGIKNADELITLATAYGLTVTVEEKDRETLTSYVVRFAIVVPTAYAGTELGRTIAGDTLTLLWTKAHRQGARGRLEDATRWTATDHNKLRTLRAVTAAVETLGSDAQKHARDAAPLPKNVDDASHALFINGQRRSTRALSADSVRRIVRTRRMNGRPTHQDADGAIICENHSYVPETAGSPAPAEERMHVRIVNGGAPEIITTRDALAEIDAAMMQPGKRDVRTMTESWGHSRIVYKDPARGTVDLRPLRKGQAPAAHEQLPTVQELVGPVDDALLASYAEMYAAVDDGTAIPVRADMVRPVMEAITIAHPEGHPVDIVTHHNGPGTMCVSITGGGGGTYAPDFHLMVTVDSLTRLYASASPTAAPVPAVEEQHDRVENGAENPRDARRRAICALYTALSAAGMYSLTSVDHVATGPKGETWTVLYRNDGAAPAGHVWDAFAAHQDPGPGLYREQIAERLMTTNEVVALLIQRDATRKAAGLLGNGDHWLKQFRVFGLEPKIEPVDRAEALSLIVWAQGEGWQCYRADAGGVNLESTTGESSYWLKPLDEEQRAAEADRIRTAAAREAYAWGVRREAQQLGTNQVIEERARKSLAAVMHEEAGEGKAGFVFRTGPRGVWLRGVTSEGDDWPLLTEALRLHLEHYGWTTETSRSFGVSIVPPGDAGALVMEGQRRSVATAHAQAFAENAQR